MRNSSMRILLCGSILATGAISSNASAQTASPNVVEPTPGQAVEEAPAGTAAAQETQTDDSQLEEIVVTAQRRNESQQSVPISITTVTALAAERLGVTGTETLGVAVPTLQFGRQIGNGATPFLRGVGTSQATAGVESSVAVYLDDVYIGAPSAAVLRFNSIESTEVLKGPQGTLFGRNATGGVVNIHTRRPSHEAAIEGNVGVASFGTYYGALYATTGVSDNLAANIAVTGYNQSRGYGRSVVTGDDIYKNWNYGLRGQILWEPGADTSLLLAADYSRYRGDQGMNAIIAPGTIGAGGGGHPGKYRSLNFPSDYSTNRTFGFSGKLNHDFGGVALVSITAYRDARIPYYITDLDASLPGAPQFFLTEVTNGVRSFSQELQLVSPKEKPLRWIAGVFYYNAFSYYEPIRFTGVPFAAYGGSRSIFGEQRLRSYAAFGEANWDFAPRTTLTVGLRYTTDFISLDARQFNAAGVLLQPFNASSGVKDFSKLTYRAILDYTPTDDILLYGSYSRGFKSGGYNLTAPIIGLFPNASLSPIVEPEVLDAYEIGIKSELFGRQVRLNASAFYYDYSNLQVTSIQGGTSLTLNAAASRIKGVDVDLTYAPSRRFNLTAGVAILDSRFSSFPNGPFNVANPAVCTPVPRTTGPLTGGNTTCFVDLTGNYTQRAPKFTGTISATYTHPTEIGDFVANLSLYHNSGYFWEVSNRFRQPKVDLLNATLSWRSPDDHYGLKVYARNLFNEYYYNYFSESNARDAGSPDMPRNFGIEASFKF